MEEKHPAHDFPHADCATHNGGKINQPYKDEDELGDGLTGKDNHTAPALRKLIHRGP